MIRDSAVPENRDGPIIPCRKVSDIWHILHQFLTSYFTELQTLIESAKHQFSLHNSLFVTFWARLDADVLPLPMRQTVGRPQPSERLLS
jgi:hypothetical protein